MLSAVSPSRGETHKPDLCYLRVSHSSSHRTPETPSTRSYFCTQILEICCGEERTSSSSSCYCETTGWPCPRLLVVSKCVFLVSFLVPLELSLDTWLITGLASTKHWSSVEWFNYQDFREGFFISRGRSDLTFQTGGLKSELSKLLEIQPNNTPPFSSTSAFLTCITKIQIYFILSHVIKNVVRITNSYYLVLENSRSGLRDGTVVHSGWTCTYKT